MSIPVFRFAPSPTGLLHTGHAYSALYTFEAAKQAGGIVLLRIEDIDTGRCRDEYINQIYEDLAWLGLDWPRPVRQQSRHFDDYARAIDKLKKLELLYPCNCSRREIAEKAGPDPKRDPDGSPVYPGTCRRKSPVSGAVAWRLDMERALALVPDDLGFHDAAKGFVKIDPAAWGDVVLVRKDTPASYHLSVVVDDALQGITHVTRGTDMFRATDIHRLLQYFLDLHVPVYDHHRLIRDTGGRKLSKSSGDMSLKALRESGVTSRQLKAMLGFEPV